MDAFHVGIDVGGTFTDVCVSDQSGRIHVYKTPTQPDIGSGVIEGLNLAAQDRGLDLPTFLAAVERFGHGSTVAVNALLQRKGVRTGVITTKGFRDTLWIARMMAMTTGLPPEHVTHYRRRQRPDPMVERSMVWEVEERINFKGDVVVALDRDKARRVLRELIAQNVEAVAICTLWSFRNPVHEQMLRDLVKELAPELYVSISSEVVPVIKEYERMATTVVNAYLGPVVRSYLSGMKAQLASAGFSHEFSMLNSVGGVMPPEEASLKPIQLLSSGPAGGALAAQTLARQVGEPNVLTADMGGTSFDAGIIVDFEPILKTEAVVGNLNLLCPMISIHSIGTGGGSIAESVDGRLKVGPLSAGSFPGPACYGRGGTRPTVTDANLVLGYLNPSYFLGGRMRLDAEASTTAIRIHIAEPLGMSVLDAAAGIREIADNHMADLLRQSTLERGFDPREFCLFPFGGAGPVHAASFGKEAGVRSILVPVTASVLSAQGILSADLRLVRQRSVLQRSAGDVSNRARGLNGPALEEVFAELESEVGGAATRYGMAGEEQQSFRRVLGMRYARQVHEIAVAVEGPLAIEGAMENVVRAFDAIYEHRFGKGTGSRSASIEITTCHLHLVRKLPRIEPALRSAKGTLQSSETRRLYLKEWAEIPVYRWDDLPAGAEFSGPALVDSAGTTVWVSAAHRALVDRFGNLRLEAI